jgi:hypothetical protein
LHSRQIQQLLSFMGKAKREMRMGKGLLIHEARDMAQLSRNRFEKF